MFIYLDLLHYGYLEGVREFIVHFFFFFVFLQSSLPSNIISAALSATAYNVAVRCPLTCSGITDASTTLTFSVP